MLSIIKPKLKATCQKLLEHVSHRKLFSRHGTHPGHHEHVRYPWLYEAQLLLAIIIGFFSACVCKTADVFLHEEKRARHRLLLLYLRMPFNTLSRIWGHLHRLCLPVWLRPLVFRLYSWLCGCDITEAVETDLTKYYNLAEFFRRPLKHELRPIDATHRLTSPVDGRVLSLGLVHRCHLQQVKGITYSLRGFLGPLEPLRQKLPPAEHGPRLTTESISVTPSPVSTMVSGEVQDSPTSSTEDSAEGTSPLDDADYQEEMKHSPQGDSKLFFCEVYISPGNYHRFHSPADWLVTYRRHFTGKLLSVNPHIVKAVSDLFVINERVVYFGEWSSGFMSFTAVGATNVGSIHVFSDPLLQTNQHLHRHQKNAAGFYDLQLPEPGISVHKGELFGEFNFGSTVVMIFEAPESFQFLVSEGDSLKYGQPLGDFGHHSG